MTEFEIIDDYHCAYNLLLYEGFLKKKRIPIFPILISPYLLF